MGNHLSSSHIFNGIVKFVTCGWLFLLRINRDIEQATTTTAKSQRESPKQEVNNKS